MMQATFVQPASPLHAPVSPHSKLAGSHSSHRERSASLGGGQQAQVNAAQHSGSRVVMELAVSSFFSLLLFFSTLLVLLHPLPVSHRLPAAERTVRRSTGWGGSAARCFLFFSLPFFSAFRHSMTFCETARAQPTLRLALPHSLTRLTPSPRPPWPSRHHPPSPSLLHLCTG